MTHGQTMADLSTRAQTRLLDGSLPSHGSPAQ